MWGQNCVFLSDTVEFRHHLVWSEWNLAEKMMNKKTETLKSASSMRAHSRKSCIKWSVSCERFSADVIFFFQRSQRMSGKTRARSNCGSMMIFYTALKLNRLAHIRILRRGHARMRCWKWACLIKSVIITHGRTEMCVCVGGGLKLSLCPLLIMPLQMEILG